MRRGPAGPRTNGFEGRRGDFSNRAFMNGSGIECRASNPGPPVRIGPGVPEKNKKDCVVKAQSFFYLEFLYGALDFPASVAQRRFLSGSSKRLKFFDKLFKSAEYELL
jgi:hypothetical protein